jgi:hypothetical protein
MAEVVLLLPAGQTAALERLASARSLTLGQLIRLVILDYLAGPAGTEAAGAGSLARVLQGVRPNTT